MKKEKKGYRLSSIRRQTLWCYRWLLLFLAISTQVACVSSQRSFNHTFEYDAPSDSGDVIIMDFRYGDGPMTRAKDWQKKEENLGTIQGGKVHGYMPRGDDLYVKWRLKSTGQIFDDVVDLKGRLPNDISGYRIRFIVSGSQLHVYFILPNKREKIACTSPISQRHDGAALDPDSRMLSLYCSTNVIKAYPGQPRPFMLEKK